MIESLPATIDRARIIGDARAHVVPALIAASGDRAGIRFLEFFASTILNRKRAARMAVPWPTS